MAGSIHSDVVSGRCSCGGAFISITDAEYEHKVPRCGECCKPPKKLRVSITLPSLGKITIRYNVKGTRLTTLGLADGFLQDVHDEVRTGTFDPTKYLSPSKRNLMLVKKFTGEFIEQKEKFRGKRKHCSPKYIDDCRRLITKYLDPVFGEMDISAVRYKHLKTFSDSDFGTERQRSKALAILRTIIKEASKSIESMKVPEFPRLVASSLKTEFIDRETQDLILRNVRNHRPAIEMLRLLPIRPCEARALKQKDIDYRKDLITFRRHFSGNQLVEGRKSAFEPGDRYHALTFKIIPELSRILKSVHRSLDPEDFVFKTRQGKPLGINRLYKEWQLACDRAGVKRCALYDGTKHATMTHLHQNEGVPIDHLRALAGQTDRKTTERYALSDSVALTDVLDLSKGCGIVADLKEANEKPKVSR